MITDKLEYERDLLSELTKKEIRLKYKSSFLGYFWSLLHPLFFACIFYFAFKQVMDIKIENFSLFLIAGLFPWQWISTTWATAPQIFLSNTSLIKKVVFPRYYLTLSANLNDLFHFLLSIPVIILFVWVTGENSMTIHWLYGIPLLIFATFVLVQGLCLIFASINLFFRDLERIVSLLVQLFFYLTPIVYSEDMVPATYKWLIYSNPFTYGVIGFRELFLDGIFNWGIFLFALCNGMVILTVGVVVYKLLEKKFAEVV